MSRNISQDKSLLNLLKERGHSSVFLVHQLDRKICGIIILANKKKQIYQFQNIFKNQLPHKVYYAIVCGCSPPHGYLDSPVKGPDSRIHKEALTRFNHLAKFELKCLCTPL